MSRLRVRGIDRDVQATVVLKQGAPVGQDPVDPDGAAVVIDAVPAN